MHCDAQFRMLLFITTYALCFIKVSCNNETSIETHSTAGKMKENSNVSNTNITLSEEHTTASETSTGMKPVYSEGGSTDILEGTSRGKNNDSTSTTPVQNNSLNEFEVFNYTSSSTDRKPHKGRKGAPIEESLTEINPLDTIKTTDLGKQPIKLSNVTTLPTHTVVSSVGNGTINDSSAGSTIVNKNSVQEHTNQSASGVNINSKDSNTSLDLKNGTAGNKLNFSEALPSPKPKPEFTRDDNDANDNSSYSLTNAERNYVIPIVATIFAAPLLIVLAMFLYKRSKEFWERRHYRRMDFLIDGMYND